MASLFPFRPYRPEQAAAARVAAVPYDVVSTEEARALAADALSFLHVSRAEIDLPPDTNPYAGAVYEKAAASFAALQQAAPLVRDPEPTLYVYLLEMDGREQVGVAGTFSIDEYDAGVIKRHELTRRDKEDDRTRHILQLRSQTGPVFLVHRESEAVAAVVAHARRTPPIIDFVAVDGVRHALWRVGADQVAPLVAAFGAMPALYIADGHHRAASASRVRRELVSSGAGPGDWDHVLAVAFSEREVRILPYNRMVRDLGAYTPATFLDALRARVSVSPGPAMPRRKGEVSMRLGNDWFTLDLGPAPAGLPAADRLDVSRLQEGVIRPLLGIEDVRSDPRIEFVGGARGTSALEAHVASGRAAVAFSMFPVGIDDLMTIADEGGIMPPKSTWFEPKLRDGLLLHSF